MRRPLGATPTDPRRTEAQPAATRHGDPSFEADDLVTDGGVSTDLPSSKRVLVVEDDETAAFELTHALENAGVAHVDVVETGVGAIGHFLRDGPEDPLPDLVLLDFHLPNDEGPALLREFTTNPQLSDVPVIALRWRDDPDHHEHAYELGAKAYLTKPADREALQWMVTGIVGPWLSAMERSEDGAHTSDGRERTSDDGEGTSDAENGT